MTRRPFDHGELDRPTSDAERTITELERYAMTSDSDAPNGLADRIMASIEHEPAPRRGLLAWLTTPSPTGGGPGRFVRAGAMAATLVLAVGGALFAGQLADLVRDIGGESTPTPVVSPSSSGAPSILPTPSSSMEPSPSTTPEASDDNGGSGVVPTGQPSPHGTATATPEETAEESQTPRPSATATASPTATPAQSS